MSRDSVPTARQPSASENTPAAWAAAIRPAEYPNSTSGRTPQLSSKPVPRDLEREDRRVPERDPVQQRGRACPGLGEHHVQQRHVQIRVEPRAHLLQRRREHGEGVVEFTPHPRPLRPGARDHVQLPHVVGDQTVPVTGAAQAAGAQQSADAAAEMVGEHGRSEPFGEGGADDLAPAGVRSDGHCSRGGHAAHLVHGAQVDDVPALGLALAVDGVAAAPGGDRQTARAGQCDELPERGHGRGREHAEGPRTDDMTEVGGGPDRFRDVPVGRVRSGVRERNQVIRPGNDACDSFHAARPSRAAPRPIMSPARWSTYRTGCSPSAGRTAWTRPNSPGPSGTSCADVGGALRRLGVGPGPLRERGEGGVEVGGPRPVVRQLGE